MKASKHKLRIVFFVAIFLAAYLISETGMLLVYKRNASAYIDEYKSSCRKNVEALTEHFGNSLLCSMQTTSMIFSQRWYKHLRNYVGYYEQEFDSAYKQEILQGIVRTVTSMQYANDVLVIAPEVNAVLSKNGWFTPEEYMKVYGSVSISITGDDNKTVSVSGNAPYILLNDTNNRKYMGYAVVILNVEKLQKQFQALKDENAVYIHVWIDDTALFEIGTPSEEQYAYTASYIYPNLRATIGYLPADTSDSQTTFLLLSAILLLVFIVIGLLEYRRVMRPVHNLVMASGGNKSDLHEPFDYVHTYIEHMQSMQTQLTIQNRDQLQALHNMAEQTRTAILYGMLTMRSYPLDTQNILSIFPWIHEVRDMCLFGLASNAETIVSIQSTCPLDGARYIVQTPTNTGYFAVVWLNNDLSCAEKLEYAFLLRREWGKKNDALCFLSPIFDDFTQLGSIGNALENSMSEGIKIFSALPENARAQIADLLREKDSSALEALLQKLSGNYEATDVLNWLYALSDNPTVAREADWKNVREIMEELLHAEIQNEAAVSEEAKKYLAYIDAHICDSELSISKVADEFDKHRTVISKEIKLLTGMTFTDYLRAHRIQIALERIHTSSDNIMQIADEVGYVSYSTFKRAFIQITGKTPIEYRSGIESEE